MSLARGFALGLLLLALLPGCTRGRTVAQASEPDVDPNKGSLLNERIQQISGRSVEGNLFLARLETTQGPIVIEVHPEWAPRGAKRFRELVESGFYDECRFFRVIPGFVAQVGMSGDPTVHAAWENRSIRDDVVIQSNKRGYVTFAASEKPDSRTTQFFINLKNNTELDRRGFAPIGKVIEGMDIADSLFSGYGDEPGQGPDQGKIARKGNAYLKQEFSRLDYIERATIEGPGAGIIQVSDQDDAGYSRP